MARARDRHAHRPTPAGCSRRACFLRVVRPKASARPRLFVPHSTGRHILRLARKPILLAFTSVLELLSASTSPQPAPAATVGAFATCPACTSATRCQLVNGRGSTACTVKAVTGCEEELGICVCGNCSGYAADVPADRLEHETPFGRLTLHPVGKHRYAAWACTGDLIFLAERTTTTGPVTELPVAPYRERYSYQKVSAATTGNGD